MPKFNIVIPHQLSQEEAMNRIQKLFDRIKHETPDKISDVKEEWTKNSCMVSFTAMSFKFSGKITVESTQVKLDADLPILVMPFKSKIEETIRKEATELLNPNT